MRSLINKGLKTAKYDGFWVLFTRILKFGLVKVKRILRPRNEQNIERWSKLKNEFKGERIFIIGNGPSLNQMPLYLLENEYTIGFNRFSLMFERLNWLPDFYMVVDDLVIKDMYDEINSEILPKVQYAFFPDIHPSNVEFVKYIEDRENVYWLNTDKPEFREDLPNCGINKTVVNAAIQVSAYLGFTEIFLIGVDMTFETQKVKKLNSRNWIASESDPNHFDPRYFGEGRKYHNPTVHEMLEKFQLAKEFFTKRGINIYNAGIGGNLEVFPRVDFNTIFDIHEEEILKILNNSKILRDRDINIHEVLKSPVVDKELPNYPEIFQTDFSLGYSLIPNLIETYLPIGPFSESYFFIKR